MAFHSFRHFHLFRHINRELTELYASVSIRTFAVSLIAIFEPIYLYVALDRSLAATLLFFGVSAIGFGLLAPLGAKLISRIGVKHAMLLSIVPLLFYFIFLWNIELGMVMILGTLFTRTIYGPIFWPAFHMDFARFSSRKYRGSEVSYGYFLITAAAIAGPITGGFIIAFFGFPVLFLFVLILSLVSIIPLFLSREVHERYHDSFEEAYREVIDEKNRNMVVAFAAEGVESTVHLYLWPLFLFLIAISFSSIGVITSATLLFGTMFGLIIGRLCDHRDKAQILRYGTIMMAASWILKIFPRTLFGAFSIYIVYQLSFTAASIPYFSFFYDRVARDRKERDRVIILREVSYNVVRGILLLIGALVMMYAPNVALAFPVAAFAALFLNLIAKEAEYVHASK